MKHSVMLFGSTLAAVSQRTETQLGRESVAPGAKAMVFALALGAAMSMSDAHAQALTPGHAIGAGSGYSEYVPGVSETTVSAKEGGAAGVVGTIVGGVVGAVATTKASPVVKLLGVFGGAWAGKELAESAVGGADKSAGASEDRPGSTRVSPQSYREAVARSASPVAAQPAPGFKALDADMQTALYSLIVDAGAKRMVAHEANDRYNSAAIRASLNPGNAKIAAQLSAANDDYKAKFAAYATAYQTLSNALTTAANARYDVQAQLTMLRGMPVDAAPEAPAVGTWPGVQQRMLQLGEGGQKISMIDLAAQSESVREASSFQSVQRM